MRPDATRRLSDRHEADLAEWFGGEVVSGSGNQWHRPGDVRCPDMLMEAKATAGDGIRVTRAMITKIEDEAADREHALALRFYFPGAREVQHDLVALAPPRLVELRDLAGLHTDAVKAALAIRDDPESTPAARDAALTILAALEGQ